MKLILSNRALSILYNFLSTYKNEGYTLLLPSNICHDVFFLILNLEFPFLIIDIENDNLCIDRKKVQDFIKSSDKVILLYNHTYGNLFIPYDFFKEIKNSSSSAIIIDDRCLCFPSMEITSSDDYIDLIIYSTGHGKQIDLGIGGFGFIKTTYNLLQHKVDFDEKKYSILKSLFNSDINKLINAKSLLTTCLIPKVEIASDNNYQKEIEKEGEKWNKHKIKLRTIYETLFSVTIQMPVAFNNWRFNILVKNKNQILEKIFENNLFASSHYPSIGTKINSTNCKVANQLHCDVLNLFIDKYYTEEMALKTTKIVNQLLK